MKFGLIQEFAARITHQQAISEIKSIAGFIN